MASVQVRYIVLDVDAAIEFYTKRLGFTLVMHPAKAFAMLSRGELRLVLSAPNPMGGGGQAMPDGTMPQPGGWNRFAIEVDDLDSTVDSLRTAGVHFRNEIVTGVGGKQIIAEDPSGNPIELFQPTMIQAALRSSSVGRARSGFPTDLPTDDERSAAWIGPRPRVILVVCIGLEIFGRDTRGRATPFRLLLLPLGRWPHHRDLSRRHAHDA